MVRLEPPSTKFPPASNVMELTLHGRSVFGESRVDPPKWTLAVPLWAGPPPIQLPIVVQLLFAPVPFHVCADATTATKNNPTINPNRQTRITHPFRSECKISRRDCTACSAK